MTVLPDPAPGLRACVVVPARDEEERIGRCLAALAAQAQAEGPWEILVVLDACVDGTEAAVRRAARGVGVPIRTIAGPGRGSGAARALGMDVAAERLRRAGSPDGLIASTDADSRVAADWLAVQQALAAAGAAAIGGLVELDLAEPSALDAAAARARAAQAVERLRVVQAADPAAEHHHFAGASLAVTAATYEAVGGMEPLTALEDEGFARRLEASGVGIVRAASVRVQTSPRSAGRATRGLATDLAVADWRARRRYDADAFSPAELRAAKAGRSVAVVLPAREVAATVAGVVARTVEPLREAGLVDEVLVIDAGSQDGTAQAAAAAGAEVCQQDALRPELGPALGKGDAMWRALSATDADLVCFLDADTEDPDPRHLLGLLGPLLAEPDVCFVKGAFDRPFRVGEGVLLGEGGRVTELLARPLLAVHAPLLRGFRQPLAGEVAARRDVLEAIPFPVGYGVEIAMLLDVLGRFGLDAMAQSWLGTRQNRHQSLSALSEMAYAVLVAAERRFDPAAPLSGAYDRDGVVADVAVLERPPLASYRAGLALPGAKRA